MKKKHWILLAILALTVLTFLGYRAVMSAVRDSQAPEISVPEGILEIVVGAQETELLQGVTAADKRDGDVTASLIVEKIGNIGADCTATVTYAAFDAAGNVAKASRDVLFTDYVSPRFRLNRALVFTAGSNFDLLSVMTAEDMIDGDISHRIRAANRDGGTVTVQGTYNVLFQVTNSLGDTAELTVPVEVQAAGLYNATVTLTDYLIYLNVGDSFHAKDYLERFNVGRSAVSLQGTMPSYISVDTEGEVDTNTPGVYTVAYTVTNEKDNVVYTAYTKLVVVVEG